MAEPGDKIEGRGVQSIEIGGRILNALTSKCEPMMLKEIASDAAIAPAQAHAYLASYRKLGLVEKTDSGNRYRLGPMALSLGIARMQNFDPLKLIRQGVTDLSRQTGLTVLVSVWGGFGPTVVAVQEGIDQVHMNTKVGTVYSLSGTATGRAFSAFIPENLKKEFDKLNKSKMASAKFVGLPQSLKKSDLAQIRREGYAIVDPPPVPGVQPIASPVFDHMSQVVAVVTILSLDRQLDRSPESRLVHSLLSCTQHLSSQLGYQLGV